MLETGGDVIITIRHNGHNAGPARAPITASYRVMGIGNTVKTRRSSEVTLFKKG